MLLFLITNMAAVMSPASQQFCKHVLTYVLPMFTVKCKEKYSRSTFKGNVWGYTDIIRFQSLVSQLRVLRSNITV